MKGHQIPLTRSSLFDPHWLLMVLYAHIIAIVIISLIFLHVCCLRTDFKL